jgi:heat shock protein HspQ
MTIENTALFSIGQIIQHRLFEYRGVIIDIDPEFHGSESWYMTNAGSKPPKDSPWYHVLVDGGELRTYVAERNLLPDHDGGPIKHPGISRLFSGLGDDGYVPRRHHN